MVEKSSVNDFEFRERFVRVPILSNVLESTRDLWVEAATIKLTSARRSTDAERDLAPLWQP